ncbi:MAG: hypothetical protein HKN79_02260 [Flavobacteriales bacterium]|nr:hypothetical protein [Flavobacteriales bacterium]
MGVWQNIKDFFAESKLRKIKQDRSRKVVNYHQARDIGVIYPSENESMYILAKHFVDYLKKEHGISKVLALGYIDAKEAPFYHAHVLMHDYFTAKEVNWFGYPSGQAVDSFVARDFDILIDLSDGNNIPLRFVLERSHARFKVGRNLQRESYDLLIDMKEESTLDLYIRQMNHYLNAINHHEERQRV